MPDCLFIALFAQAMKRFTTVRGIRGAGTAGHANLRPRVPLTAAAVSVSRQLTLRPGEEV